MTCLTKILSNQVTKPQEVPSEANLRILADLCRYALTLFMQGSPAIEIDFKLIYAVLHAQNLLYCQLKYTDSGN